MEKEKKNHIQKWKLANIMLALDQNQAAALAFPSFYFTSYTSKHKNVTNTHTKYEKFPFMIQIFRNPIVKSCIS